MAGRAHWLLEVTIEGRTYRWAVEGVAVPTEAGTVLEYVPGLADQSLSEGEIGVRIEVTDRSVDWPALADEVETAPTVLRRWTEGTTHEAATVITRGEARGVEHGSRSEPVGWVVEEAQGVAESLGVAVPDPLARVDDTTWPLSTGDEGATYPVIFGYPGHTGASTPEPVVPCPLAQWSLSDTTTYIVVSEDVDAPITGVRVRNDSTDTEADESVAVVVDSLGRSVRCANFLDDSGPKPGQTEQRELFVGYHPDTGGGVARTAYDVIAYLLRRWGPDTVDWVRLPEIADVLAGYQVDTWIDDPLSDPWAWIESVLVPDLLLEVRRSARGRYLVQRRYTADVRRSVGVIEAGRNAERVGPRARETVGPSNEITGWYRRSAAEEWLARVVLTGDGRVRSAPDGVADPGATTTQQISVERSQRCARSAARFGLRQAEPLKIDWTWDTGTVARVLHLRAEREALPWWLLSYDVLDGDQMTEGDVVTITDAQLILSNVAAIVDAPPVVNRSRWARVALRIEGF